MILKFLTKTNRSEKKITERQIGGIKGDPKPQVHGAIIPWNMEEWRDWAACKNIDTRLFFADLPIEAKTLCDICPVAVECLDYALRENIHYGVWGGTTAAERSDVRRKLRATLPQMLEELDTMFDLVSIELAEQM